MMSTNSGLRARPRASAVAASLFLLAAAPAFSQSHAQAAAAVQVAAADPVVITAARRAQPLSQVLADVSVIDRSAIERSGATSLADLLVQLPGVEMARNGGPGNTTSVFIRGGESRHVAVYLDGLRIESQATGGAAWEMLPIEEIDRIELLRGPAAALYGSDAINGVVQLFTRRGGGPLQAGASVAYGTHATVQARASVSGAAGPLDYALSASHGRSDGFNARTTATTNPDADGWRRSGLTARIGTQLAPGHRLDLSLLAGNMQSQYDSSPTDDDVNHHTLRALGLTWEGNWSAHSSTRLQLGQTASTYESRPSFYRTETTLRTFLLQHGVQLGAHHLDVALERREDELLNPATQYAPTLQGKRSQDGLSLGWRMDVGAHAFQANLRHDHDSEFGNQPTGSLAWGWQLLPAWRVTASAGTSFRAPTLYQRYSEYGNNTLDAERGRNVELGLRWTEGNSMFSATAWRNRVRNLIDFGAPGSCASEFGCYASVGNARYEGITFAGDTRWAGVGLLASATYQEPRNLDLERQLRRRARVLATLAADGRWAGWGWGVALRGSGGRFDDAANNQRLGGYVLVNLSVERALTDTLTLEARVDNATDKAYTLARTYATDGRTVQLGLRWALR